MSRKIWLTILIGGLVLLAFMIISVLLQRDLPKPTGPFSVGRTSRLWVDSSRPEGLTDNPNDFREVPVEIWYPAQAGTGAKAPYFPDLDHLAQTLVDSGEVDAIEVWGLPLIQSQEFLDAQIARDSDAYPVIIFSPGNGTNVEFYATIADELASHGTIVVGINHPYDVAAVALSDETVAQFKSGPFEFQANEAWVQERMVVRTLDVLFVLSQLEKTNSTPEDFFAGRFDLEQIGMAGHSMGGITASQACLADGRLDACLNMDGLQRGGPFSASEDMTPPNQPFMMITKEKEFVPTIMEQFKAIPSGSYRVVINEATHENFTDGPVLLPSILPTPNEADGILALVRAYTLAFFDQTLKQQRSGLLEQPLQNPQVILEVYPAH